MYKQAVVSLLRSLLISIFLFAALVAVIIYVVPNKRPDYYEILFSFLLEKYFVLIIFIAFVEFCSYLSGLNKTRFIKSKITLRKFCTLGFSGYLGGLIALLTLHHYGIKV